MIVKGLTIKNPLIHYENIHCDFSKKGIYLIKGENGTGKTTFIESLIFEENSETVFFLDELHNELYWTNRWLLIAYVPQTIIDVPLTVEQYLRKGNRNISDERMFDYINRFKLNDIKLEQNFSSLSGGEKTKLAIIAALLKDTPFIILDEPTNHLDDESVLILKECLFEEKDKTIIMVTHDKRMDIEPNGEVVFNLNSITVNLKKVEETNHYFTSSTMRKINPFRLMLRAINKKLYAFIFLLITLVTFLLIGINYFYVYFYFAHEPLIPPNIINVYSIEKNYVGGLNERYVKGEGLDIDPTRYGHLIGYDDIVHIAEMEQVAFVILSDYSMVREADIQLELFAHGEIEALDLYVFSPPELVYEYSLCCTFLPNGATRLLEGRLPQDEQYEVALSPYLLQTYFNFTDQDVPQAIGKTISFNHTTYTIVGLLATDVMLISYQPDNLYGLYIYDPATYIEYKERNLNYIKENYIRFDHLDTFLIYTKDGFERYVLNTLMKTYPANNYESNYYGLIWEQQYNRDKIILLTIFNLIIGLIFGLLVLINFRNLFRYHWSVLKDYAIYYLDSGRIQKSYAIITVISIMFILVISLVFSSFLNRKTSLYGLVNQYVYILLVMLYSPFMIFLGIKRINKINEI